MSEFYEGAIICGGADLAAAEFNSLDSKRPLRLVRLNHQTYGIYPVASRSDPLDESATNSIACQLSGRLGAALAVSYDNRCGLNFATLFVNGSQHRSFDEQDALWVSLDHDSHPTEDGPQLTANELEPDGEYSYLRSPIDVGLTYLSADKSVSFCTLKQAFCYEDAELMAETGTD